MASIEAVLEGTVDEERNCTARIRPVNEAAVCQRISELIKDCDSLARVSELTGISSFTIRMIQKNHAVTKAVVDAFEEAFDTSLGAMYNKCDILPVKEAGAMIRRAIDESALNVSEVADAIGLTSGALYNALSGHNRLKGAYVRKIEDLLEVDLGSVRMDDENESPAEEAALLFDIPEDLFVVPSIPDVVISTRDRDVLFSDKKKTILTIKFTPMTAQRLCSDHVRFAIIDGVLYIVPVFGVADFATGTRKYPEGTIDISATGSGDISEASMVKKLIGSCGAYRLVCSEDYRNAFYFEPFEE